MMIKRLVLRLFLRFLKIADSLQNQSYSDEMINVLQKAFGDNTTFHMNTGIHRSEEHLHFHIVPTKGGIRDFVSKLEGVPKRKDVSQEVAKQMRDHILEFLK